MKRVVCETCGGSDLIMREGMWVCQHCGSKYVIEELAGASGAQPASAYSREDQIQDLLTDAGEKFNADRYDAAINAYNRVLRIDPKNVWAISNRGNAYGWKTSVHESYVDKAVEATRHACEVAFEQYGDTPDYYGFCWRHLTRSQQMLNAVARMYANHYNEAYENATNDAARADARKKLKERTEEMCETLVELNDIVLGFSEDHAVADYTFWRILHIGLDNCRYYCEWGHIEQPERVSAYERKVRVLRDAAYWEEHPEERAELDRRRVEAVDAIATLRAQLKEDEAELEQSALEAEICDLKRRRGSLRLFDLSGRNELRNRIESLKEKRDRARQAAKERLASRGEELSQLERRIEEIDSKIAREGAED